MSPRATASTLNLTMERIGYSAPGCVDLAGTIIPANLESTVLSAEKGLCSLGFPGAFVKDPFSGDTSPAA